MTHLSAETGPLATTPTLARIAAALSRPRLFALACILVLASAGWAWLVLAGVWQPTAGASGFLDVICRAMPASAGSPGAIALIAAMWVAMTLAMMLPSAGPMILTYSEIAETASRKGERIVSPLVLVGGYLAVWLGFSGAATLTQLGAMSLAASSPDVALVAIPASALLFLIAGLYQFSSLKAACLRACQRPFSFFFLNWTDRTAGVFRLGLRQGLYCLGCCWAMMLLMFATGAMNVVWMALLGIVMTVEKMTTSQYFSRVVGIAFSAAGLVVLAAWGFGILS